MTRDERSEMVEIIRLYYQDYEYRHKTFWEIVFKSLFAILGLIGLPFVLFKENFMTQFLYVFPIASCVLCVFSVLLLQSEAVRMQAIKKRYRILLKELSTDSIDYTEPSIRELTAFSPLRIKITNQMQFLYFLLFIISLLEIAFILMGKFA